MPEERQRMNCDLDYTVLHSYFDGELTVVCAAPETKTLHVLFGLAEEAEAAWRRF